VTSAIETSGLTKRYGSTTAVAGLDLRVDPGQVFGFLGPNGAGKSTIIRMLLALQRPTRGRAVVLGLDAAASSAELHRRVGYLPGDLELFPRLTGRQHIAWFARARSLGAGSVARQLADRFQVVAGRPVRELSKGNRQKIGLVLAFMHRPELLLLDEPKAENQRLRALLNEAGMSNKGLARRVVDLAGIRGVANIRCDHTSVLRWLAGEQPRAPVPELVAVVLGDALGRPVPETELGMTPSDLPADLGLHLPTVWTESVAISTALWRADVQRRRFLVNAAFASAALPASALRWLTSPPADAPAADGSRRVGRADIDAIRELTLSYRDIDNRLGEGNLRVAVVSYLDNCVSGLLTNGSYREETGRQLAAACGELSQLAGWVAYDSGEHGLAQRYLTQALGYARHASDSALAAEILAAQAHQAIYLSQPDEAIDLSRAAQTAASRNGSATLLTSQLAWRNASVT
jgi:ABC-type lipoprotein export system ATPase subunit